MDYYLLLPFSYNSSSKDILLNGESGILVPSGDLREPTVRFLAHTLSPSSRPRRGTSLVAHRREWDLPLRGTLLLIPLYFLYGGESGIRTHGTISRTHAFQACAFDHSATSPRRHNAHSFVFSIKDCKPLHRSHYVSSFDKIDAHFAKPQLHPPFCRAVKNDFIYSSS